MNVSTHSNRGDGLERNGSLHSAHSLVSRTRDPSVTGIDRSVSGARENGSARIEGSISIQFNVVPPPESTYYYISRIIAGV